MPPVFELRVALTVSDWETLYRIYTLGLGIAPAADWTSETSKGVLFELGSGTLELFDEGHAAMVDQIEVGARVSGAVRLALRVPDVDAAVARIVAAGAALVHTPVFTPWGDYNARVETPDGLQITLYQADKEQSGASGA